MGFDIDAWYRELEDREARRFRDAIRQSEEAGEQWPKLLGKPPICPTCGQRYPSHENSCANINVYDPRVREAMRLD